MVCNSNSLNFLCQHFRGTCPFFFIILDRGWLQELWLLRSFSYLDGPLHSNLSLLVLVSNRSVTESKRHTFIGANTIFVFFFNKCRCMALIAFILFSPVWPRQVRLSLYWLKAGSLVQRQLQCRFLAKADGSNLHLPLRHET